MYGRDAKKISREKPPTLDKRYAGEIIFSAYRLNLTLRQFYQKKKTIFQVRDILKYDARYNTDASVVLSIYKKFKYKTNYFREENIFIVKS